MHPTTRMTSSGHWMKPTNNSITKNTAMRQYHVTGGLNATARQMPYGIPMRTGCFWAFSHGLHPTETDRLRSANGANGAKPEARDFAASFR